MVSDVAMHPIDCIKTLQQSDEGMGLSMLGAAQGIFGGDGLQGFYRGFGAYAACDAVAGAIKFGTYESLKRSVEQYLPPTNNKNLLTAALFACAALSSVTSSVIAVPGELLKQQLQMGHYTGCWEAASSIWEAQGLAGFYQGYDGVFLRDVPYTAMELGLYDLFKTMYQSSQTTTSSQPPQDDENENHCSQANKLQTSVQIVLAGLTGGIAGYLTTPLDTIKTKLMVDSAYAHSNVWNAFMTTIHDHGLESVTCGAAARVLWMAPLCAIYLPAYDFFKQQVVSKAQQEQGEEAM
jgi:hypothetical protein